MEISLDETVINLVQIRPAKIMPAWMHFDGFRLWKEGRLWRERRFV
jgi:hypothetical protein